MTHDTCPAAGRMALLVTLFLVLVNIFNSVTANSPKAEGRYMNGKQNFMVDFCPTTLKFYDCSGMFLFTSDAQG